MSRGGAQRTDAAAIQLASCRRFVPTSDQSRTRTFQGSVVVLHREDSGPPVVEVGVEVVPALPAEVAAVVVLPVEAEEDPVAEEDNTLDFIQHKSKDLVNARSFALNYLLHRPNLM